MRHIILVLLILFAVSSALPATAQPLAGGIEGYVTGPGGKPLPYAMVVVAGDTLGAMAGENGWYVIHRVAPGTYRVRAAMLGFASVEFDSVVVVAGRATRLDVRFKRRLWVPKPATDPREEWIRDRPR